MPDEDGVRSGRLCLQQARGRLRIGQQTLTIKPQKPDIFRNYHLRFCPKSFVIVLFDAHRMRLTARNMSENTDFERILDQLALLL